jgi:hypothetical protein
LSNRTSIRGGTEMSVFSAKLKGEEDVVVIVIFDRFEHSPSTFNGDFVRFQQYIEVLLRMKDHHNSKQGLVYPCRQQYDDGTKM